jgi:hypothetical protein
MDSITISSPSPDMSATLQSALDAGSFDFSDTITISSSNLSPLSTSLSSSITLGSLTGAVGASAQTIYNGYNSITTANTGPYTYGNVIGGGSGQVLTTNGTGNYGWNYANVTLNPNTYLNGHSLKVAGDADFEGDVTIKGKSLMQTLEKIEQKLAIFKQNPELEEKWDELRELADKYKALEKEIIEKEKMWDILKK